MDEYNNIFDLISKVIDKLKNNFITINENISNQDIIIKYKNKLDDKEKYIKKLKICLINLKNDIKK
jgi:hypothetical protein